MVVQENVAIFYTARTGSSRLPEKMLIEISGKTVAELGLERAAAYGKCPVIMCTTTRKEDDVLAELAERMGVVVYRGEVNDVLERYRGAAEEHGTDFFIAIDGDDLFVEHVYLDKIIDTHKTTNADFVYCDALPYGTYGTGVKTAALRKVCEIKDDEFTEGWGRYFTKTNLFKTERIDAEPRHRHPEYRLTLDYPEDLVLYEKIYEALYVSGKMFILDEVLAFLKGNPKLARLNWSRKDEYARRFKKKYSAIRLKNSKFQKPNSK